VKVFIKYVYHKLQIEAKSQIPTPGDSTCSKDEQDAVGDGILRPGAATWQTGRKMHHL